MNLTAPRNGTQTFSGRNQGTTRQLYADKSWAKRNNNNHFHLRAEEHPARVQGEAAHSHNDDSTVWVVETDYINSLSRSGKL